MENSTSTAESLLVNRLTVEDALNQIGTGCFHYALVSFIGLVWVADLSEILLLAFLSPQVKCEWNLTTNEASLITTTVFIGMGMGSWLCGTISDAFGRKIGGTFCTLVLAIAGLGTSFAPNYMWLLVARGTVGIGIGGMNSIFSMTAEFLPKDSRGSMLCITQLCGGMGGLLVSILAWVILPRFGWRALVLATATLPMILLVIFPFVPESPRYLMVKGQDQRAWEVLQLIAHTNGKTCPSGSLYMTQTSNALGTRNFSLFIGQLEELFKYPFNKITPAVWAMWFFVGLSYYGAVVILSTVQSSDDGDECSDGELKLKDSDYLEFLLTSIAQAFIPCLLLPVFNRLGRRTWYTIMFWLYILLLIPLLFDSPGTDIFLLSALPFAQINFLVINVITAEVYPSSCRAFAIGMGNIASRIGGGLSPFLYLPLYNAFGLQVHSGFYAFVYFLSSILSFLIPFETLGKPLPDQKEDVIRLLNQETQV